MTCNEGDLKSGNGRPDQTGLAQLLATVRVKFLCPDFCFLKGFPPNLSLNTQTKVNSVLILAMCLRLVSALQGLRRFATIDDD